MNKLASQATRQVTAAPLTAPVLQRKCECGNHTPAGGECQACGKPQSTLQRKTIAGANVSDSSPPRVADQAVVSNTTPPSVSPLAFGRLQREEAPKEKTNEEKYKEGLEKLGEAFLKTPLGKELLEKIRQDTLVKGVTELGKDFISTWPGKIVTGAAATGAVAALAATHKALPAQIPEIPLDVLTPGLSVQLTYKGPVDKPTEAMITFKFTEQAPKGRDDKKPMSATDKFRAETARLAAEDAKFRAGMTYEPGSAEDLQQKAEQEATRNAVLKYSGGPDIEATIKKYPWLATPQPKTGFQLTLPKPSFGIKPPALLGNEFKLKPPSEQKKKEDEPVLQKKLSIGASNDPLEDEADRIADQVLAASPHPAASVAPVRIQRFTGQAADEGTATAPASVDRVLASSGRPMEPALRQDMEQRFGHDFSRVRVHTDATAEQSARNVNAHAYTVGHNIVFGQGQFAPGTHAGRRLIAHELVHVVQQDAVSPLSYRRRGAATDDRAALRSGAYGIRLVLPTGERWIGPPLFQGGPSPTAEESAPPGESPVEEGMERSDENPPVAISHDRALQMKRCIQRRVSFTNPTPVAQDPLARLIVGGSPGLTTPTINGNVVSTAADVLTSITPTTVTGSAAGGTTTCQLDPSFNIDTSANVIVANNAGPRGWTGNIPLTFLGSPPACAGAPSSIPGVMVATPTNADFVTRVRASEQEHVDAIHELHTRHFVPYDAAVSRLRGSGPNLSDCSTNLAGQFANLPTQAGFGFVLGYAAETQRLDDPGGTHADTATPTFTSGCASVTLTLSQKNASIPGASRGNVTTVAPTVTRYDHFRLSVSGNDVVETAAPGAGAGTSRVIHSFSSAANARVGLHVFVHYGTTSKNVIGNMTHLLLDGGAAPAGSGTVLRGVTEESIDPARFQVTLGVPGASDWAITQIDGNNVRTIVNFGAQRNEAFSGVEVLRRRGVTKFAFIGSRNSPELMFFRL